MTVQSILDTIDKQVLGARLQAARINAGYSLIRTEAETNLSAVHLATIEQGEAQITPHEIIILAHLYGTQVADLLNPLPEGLSQEDILTMYERAEIGEGRAARALGVDRLELRTLVEKRKEQSQSAFRLQGRE